MISFSRIFIVVGVLNFLFEVVNCKAQTSSFSAQLGGATGVVVYDYFTDNENFATSLNIRPTASLRYHWSKLFGLKPSMVLNYSKIETSFKSMQKSERSKLNYLFVSALINPFFLRAKDDKWSIHLGFSAGQLFHTSTKVFSAESYKLRGFRSHVFGETLAAYWKYPSNPKFGIWAEISRFPSPCISYPCSNSDVCLLSSLRLSYTF